MNPLHARSGPGIDTIFVVLLSFPPAKQSEAARARDSGQEETEKKKRKSNRSSKSCQIRKRPLII